MRMHEVDAIKYSDRRTFAVISSSHDGRHYLTEIYPAVERIDEEQRRITYRIDSRTGGKISRWPENAEMRKGDFHAIDGSVMFFIGHIYVSA